MHAYLKKPARESTGSRDLYQNRPTLRKKNQCKKALKVPKILFETCVQNAQDQSARIYMLSYYKLS